MKRIIMFLLLFAALKVAGQTTGYLRFDTVKIMKQNGTCELYVINKTKDSLGLLTNVGGGLTRFIKSKVLNDSTIVIGLDTLVIPGAGGAGTSITLNNIGTGYALVATPGGNIKRINPGYGIDIDSTTTSNTITVKADTAELVTPSDLNDGLATKLNISDTTNKWLNDIRRRAGTDTVEKFKNGSWQFAYKDSIGTGGSGSQSWQQTIDVSPYTYGGLVFDTAFTKPVDAGSPAEHTWFTMNPLVPADDSVTSPFYWNQFAGLNNGQVNEVMMFGWNLGPGGGQVQAGKPALGEAWESNYRVDIGGGILKRYMEKHEYYINPLGLQYRLGSYTINTDDTLCNYYHSVDNFNIRSFKPAGSAGNTPYFSVQGVTGSTEMSLLNKTNEFDYFRIGCNYAQDVNTSNFTILNSTVKPISLFNVVNFTNASLPSLSLYGLGYDGSQIVWTGTTTGDLARWISDSSQTIVSTFTNVPMRFMPNTTQALDLRSNRVNIYQNTGIGAGVSTPIAQLDVRSASEDQTLYIENTKAGGYAGIFSTTNAAGSNVGLDITAIGAGGNNKAINFNTTTTTADWNYYANGNAKFYNKGKAGIGDGVTSPDSTLQINGSFHNNAGVRMEGLPTGPGTKAVRIDANGTLSIADTTVGGGSDGNGIYSADGTLAGDRTVATGGNTLGITGSNDSETSLTVTNTGSTAASAIAGTVTGSTGAGVTGTSTSGNGVVGTSSSNYGVVGTSSTTAAFRGQINVSSSNAIENTVSLLRTSSAGAGANGLGAAIQYELETATNGTSQTAGRLAFLWTDATNASRTSAFEIYGVNNTTTARKAALAGSGQWTWDGYGSATHSVTPATTPVISSSGVVGERIAPKIYTALLTQSGSGAPSAAVLGTNEIGSIVWTRNGTGSYAGTLSGAFTANKTWLIVQQGDQTGGFVNCILSWTDANSLLLTTTDNTGTLVDGFTNMSLEIRVYP